MARLISINVRLSTEHLRILKRISEKNGITRTDAIRLAIKRLADEERLLKRKNWPES